MVIPRPRGWSGKNADQPDDQASQGPNLTDLGSYIALSVNPARCWVGTKPRKFTLLRDLTTGCIVTPTRLTTRLVTLATLVGTLVGAGVTHVVHGCAALVGALVIHVVPKIGGRRRG